METSVSLYPLNQRFILANYRPGVRGNALDGASLIQGEFKDAQGTYYFGLPMDIYKKSNRGPNYFDLVDAAGQRSGYSSNKQRLDQTA